MSLVQTTKNHLSRHRTLYITIGVASVVGVSAALVSRHVTYWKLMDEFGEMMVEFGLADQFTAAVEAKVQNHLAGTL